jgi:hypothetical protein
MYAPWPAVVAEWRAREPAIIRGAVCMGEPGGQTNLDVHPNTDHGLARKGLQTRPPAVPNRAETADATSGAVMVPGHQTARRIARSIVSLEAI